MPSQSERRYRAMNGEDGPVVVCDTDEPGTVLAMAGRQQDVEMIAAALNAADNSVHEWRVVATDYGDEVADRSEWTTDEKKARETFRVWMDETKPPYDSVWVETRTIVASEPERVA